MTKRRTNMKLRRWAFARDFGVCAHCKADCEKAKRVYGYLWGFEAQSFYADLFAVRDEAHSFWDVDHILEVIDGGDDRLANLQTLCIACHYIKTAENCAIREKMAQRLEFIAPIRVPKPAVAAQVNYTPFQRVNEIKDWVNSYLQQTWEGNGTGEPKTLQPIQSDYYADPWIYE